MQDVSIMRTWVVAGILLAFGAPPVLATDGKAVRVFVSARAAETMDEPTRKAREAQTEDEHKRAQEVRKALGSWLEAKYGKKSQGWPAEAREQFDRAWRAEMNALLAHHEVKITQKQLDGHARTLASALGDAVKKGRITLVESADQADVTVETLTHRLQTSFPAVAQILYLKVAPVGWRDGNTQFAGTSFGQIKSRDQYLPLLGLQKLRGALTTFHPYAEAEPYWMVEIFQQGTNFTLVFQTAAEALSAFCSSLPER